jgi:cytochrome o ubiquinol oxidase operon protein cyoD
MTNHKDYFGEVGVWHKGARHLERTYVLGFLFSLILTLTAYTVSVYHIVPKTVLIPMLLVLACLQFMTQVLGFLHVSGAPASRDRLIALLYCTVLALVLVVGSMWIMMNLQSRMMTDAGTQERYMMKERGI